MTEANLERGEVPITLGGKTYPMRGSMTACEVIESKIGPICGLLPKLADKRALSLDELSIIVTESIKAAGKEHEDDMLKAMQVDRIKPLIYDAGLWPVTEVVSVLLLSMALGGGKPGKKGEDDPSKTQSGLTTES
jgi:hypothetical protein